MPVHPLPENPSLENAKKRIKDFLKRVRARDADALAEVREFHPRGEAALDGFALSDAQLVAARRFGFASWPKLKKHLEAIAPFTWSAVAPPQTLGDTFVTLACLDYTSWSLRHRDQAQQLLREHPEVARESIYSAAAAGDFESVRDFLQRDPALANRRGGPHGWEPLLYACYSRLDVPTLDVARVLLAAGADPNAGFLWHGNIPPFTALTGAFGDGEGGAHNPPHPHWRELARLLLDAGADPNDGQTLYNRHWHTDSEHLEILFAYGLGTDKGGPWYRRIERLDSPRDLLIEEVWIAARRNNLQRLKLLIEHGAPIDQPGRRDGRTPYEAALRAGNDDVAAFLVAHGAKKVELPREERFAVACINGRREQAQALLREDPTLIERLGHHGRVELLHRAVEARRAEGVRLMAELGFEIAEPTHHDGVGIYLATTPMHNAAWGGQLDLVKLLVELGASPHLRDPTFNGTPLGWADHNGQQHVVDYLMPMAGLEDAVVHGGVERAAELLERDPAKAKEALTWVNERTPRKEEMLALLRRFL